MRAKHASLLLFTAMLPVARLAAAERPVVASQDGLEAALLRAAPTLRAEALHAALLARKRLADAGLVTRPLVTIIDYSLPSTTRRLWVLDLPRRRVVYHSLVAHGRNTGENEAISFSNEEGSLMTSLGAFITGRTYVGKNGYSLRLKGMDAGLNDRAEARAIVMHGAPYVSEEFARANGRLGRSWGCPAVSPSIAHALIDRVKEGTLLYAWHPSLPPPS
ncbi:MAG TPA: murein L,D-transpeptidase catalytic domain family protein [Verrucomicrobiae bacterium]|nr:murein L,D-transpeptidase catalytic domain family protein [Verrucomicrobiae bacterium]